jgi:hypothetical protein
LGENERVIGAITKRFFSSRVRREKGLKRVSTMGTKIDQRGSTPDGPR